MLSLIVLTNITISGLLVRVVPPVIMDLSQYSLRWSSLTMTVCS